MAFGYLIKDVELGRLSELGPKVKVKWCPTLWDPMYYSLPGSSLHGILQANILEWVAISFSRGPSWLRDQTEVSCTAADALTSEPPGKALKGPK